MQTQIKQARAFGFVPPEMTLITATIALGIAAGIVRYLGMVPEPTRTHVFVTEVRIRGHQVIVQSNDLDAVIQAKRAIEGQK